MEPDRKIILVTGGNTGLGLEIVKALARSSYTYDIIVGSRNLNSGQAAVDSVSAEYKTSSNFTVVQIDLESDDSLRKAIDVVTARFGHIDVLVNNGGAQLEREVAENRLSIREAFNKSWDVNVTGTHILTLWAVPLLLKSSDPRLLFMTSGTASLAETELTEGPLYGRLNKSPPEGWPKDSVAMGLPAYRSVKTGLNMVMRNWHRILLNDNVKVFSISPGMLATGLGGFGVEKLREMGALEPSVGGEFVRDVIEGKRDAHAGKIIRNDDKIQAW